MANNKTFLVFDIGGTFLRAAAYDTETHAVSKVAILETPPLASVANGAAALAKVVEAMKRAADDLTCGAPPHSVCIGFPGPVDSEGRLHAAPTIWGGQYRDRLPLKRMAADCWPNANIEVVNDVTAAGYYFVNDTTRDFLIVTVGSGVGSKLFIGGEPVLGSNARGGEIGHLRVDFSPNANVCDCGGIGHLGAISSGRGALQSAVRLARDDPAAFRRSRLDESCSGQPDRLTNEMLVEAFLSGDGWTRELVSSCTSYLGQALAAVHLNLGIETFVMVGGFSAALGDEYRKILCEAASAAMWQNGFSWETGIHLSKADDHPGLNGAGRFLENKYGLRS